MNEHENRPDNGNQNNNRNKKNMSGLMILLGWAVVLTVVFNYLSAYSRQANTAATTHEISYSEFQNLVEDGKVKAVVITEGRLEITPVDDFTYVDENGFSYDNNFTLFTMQMGVYDQELLPFLRKNGVEYTNPYVAEMSPVLEFMLTYIVPMVLMVGLFMLFMSFMTKRGGGIGGIGSVGKANAKVYMEKSTGVTFNDVAGQDEAKESLVEIIDFLHNPGKYTAIGAKLPRGALLVGSPGTGKTLLAKAVAGEAGVPFFSISGSGFVEMFVGVGASRVRDLFQEAAKVAPCIIFIDEIDAIGKTRDSRFGSGGNDEREQTLNQLLAEMDGFDPSKGIIVLAATNRPEVLDKALLRPGRFDRRITVDRPNLTGRLATLQVHTRKIRLAEDVNLEKLAQATAGCVGADLANMVNEAALRAVRHGRLAVNQEDLLASFEMVIAGAEKKGTIITEQEKRIISYHEVGHALAAAKQKKAQPVTKITIVPHTEGTLGYTLHLPEEEKFLMSREDILTEIRTLLAGRCAEELVFDTQTSGAANDIERATELARNLIARFGMSEKFGMMALGTVQSQYLEGGYSMNCAQETFAAADREVVSLLQKCHDEALQLLRENREMLDTIASYLFQKETITGAQMMAILEGRDPDKEEYYGVAAPVPASETALPAAEEEKPFWEPEEL